MFLFNYFLTFKIEVKELLMKNQDQIPQDSIDLIFYMLMHKNNNYIKENWKNFNLSIF